MPRRRVVAVRPGHDKENVAKVPITPTQDGSRRSEKENTSTQKKPLGPRLRGTESHYSLRDIAISTPAPAKAILGDGTNATQHVADAPQGESKSANFGSVRGGSVARRMMDWEAERSRMRAILDDSDDEGARVVASSPPAASPAVVPEKPVALIEAPVPQTHSVLGKRNASDVFEEAIAPG
jgi:hypothetical protein